jgi:non-ribosomal peptide synthetase component E (peptide arylation enzyme)
VTTKAPPGQIITVTQRLLDVALSRGRRSALVSAETSCSYAEFAFRVQAAAAGLAWRGLQPGEAAGVFLPDAACYATALHAVRAAGGVPSPVAAGLTVDEIATQLTDCGARLLLTAPPLDTAAQAAAERSRVRQVISFGEAPGTIEFGALLRTGTLPPAPAQPQDWSLIPYSRAPDGTPHSAPVSHDDMSGLLRRLAAEVPIRETDVVLAIPPADPGRSYTALLDHALLSGATVVVADAGEADGLAAAAGAHGVTAVLTPDGCARV